MAMTGMTGMTAIMAGIAMGIRSWLLAALAALGVSLFAFGKIVGEPARDVPAPAGAIAAATGAGPLEWRLWDPEQVTTAVAAPPPAAAPAPGADVWATPAEWAESD